MSHVAILCLDLLVLIHDAKPYLWKERRHSHLRSGSGLPQQIRMSRNASLSPPQAWTPAKNRSVGSEQRRRLIASIRRAPPLTAATPSPTGQAPRLCLPTGHLPTQPWPAGEPAPNILIREKKKKVHRNGEEGYASAERNRLISRKRRKGWGGGGGRRRARTRKKQETPPVFPSQSPL